jgi:hypothetical protein
MVLAHRPISQTNFRLSSVPTHGPHHADAMFVRVAIGSSRVLRGADLYEITLC